LNFGEWAACSHKLEFTPAVASNADRH
jgi:hypothetical protein